MGKESTAVAASAEKMGTIAQKVPFEKTVELQGGKFDAQPYVCSQGSSECRRFDPLASMHMLTIVPLALVPHAES